MLYVPKLVLNLLSIPQLMEEKLILHFEDNACLVSDSNGTELFKVSMRNRSFPLAMQAMSSTMNDFELWHKWFV